VPFSTGYSTLSVKFYYKSNQRAGAVYDGYIVQIKSSECNAFINFSLLCGIRIPLYSRASVHETPVITLRKKSKKTRSVNNNFANRIFLGGLPVSTTGSSIGATGEAQEPAQSGKINSAWWSGTAPSSGIVNFDTIGTDFDTYLSD